MVDYLLENQIKNEKNIRFICGIDEAGRGPWAGPVTCAAVILDENNIPEGLNDSKKLSAKKRDKLAIEIKEKAIAWHIAFIDAQIIDDINILAATFLGMKEAAEGLVIKPEFALIDGNLDPKIGIESLPVVKGDGKSVSIAAASILAKTARDEYMQKAHLEYPQYGFAKNAGYGVPAHIAALKEHGPCPLHRKSFKPIKALLENNN